MMAIPMVRANKAHIILKNNKKGVYHGEKGV
jgi:hypothetical protein